MPWNPKDAGRHDKKADTSKKKEVWSRVANKTLVKTGSDARAIRVANAVIRKLKSKDE